MSAPNFKTMSDFPLIVAESPTHKVCPDCGFGNCSDADVCEDCGADLSSVEAEYDEFAAEDDLANMEWYAEKANEAQDYYEVSVESGYYTGLQFYVTGKGDFDGIEDWTDEDCDWEFGKPKAEAMADLAAAAETVREWLAQAKTDLGLTELVCVGHFSNGEAVYERAA